MKRLSWAAAAAAMKKKLGSSKIMENEKVIYDKNGGGGGGGGGAFDVFISHRGIDTKRNVAGILYEHLSGLGLRPFLDSKSMSPGHNLINQIEMAIKSCRVGIPVFSPRYCESYYCLYELALMLRSNNCIIPIFYNLKPSQLRLPRNHNPASLAQPFASALRQAKSTVGLSFDSANGDWSELLSNASDAVMKRLVEEDQRSMLLNRKPYV